MSLERAERQGTGSVLKLRNGRLQVCLVLFEQLHFYDAASVFHGLMHGRLDFEFHGATDAWCVAFCVFFLLRMLFNSY